MLRSLPELLDPRGRADAAADSAYRARWRGAQRGCAWAISRIGRMLLVLGYGNTLRSDDGVGPKVVEAIAALKLPGVLILSCDLLTPEMADPISCADSVVF